MNLFIYIYLFIFYFLFFYFLLLFLLFILLIFLTHTIPITPSICQLNSRIFPFLIDTAKTPLFFLTSTLQSLAIDRQRLLCSYPTISFSTSLRSFHP